MSKRRVLIAASAVIIISALAVTLNPSKTLKPSAPSSKIYTWDCEYPTIKPDAITLTCADGGMYIDKVKWNTWDASGAQGIGTYNVNDCNPDCADGTMQTSRVNLRLSGLTEFKGKSYLRELSLESIDGQNLPLSSSPNLDWDVMEFSIYSLGS